MKDRILKYLADGVKSSDVATIVGCSKSYISQLLSEEDFRSQLEEEILRLNATPNREEEALTTKYATLEHKVIEAIHLALGDAKLGELTRTLEVVAKRQNDTIVAKRPVNNSNVTIVQLTLPAHMQKPEPKVILNDAQEVIAIGPDVLAPMSANGVRAMFDQLRKQQEESKEYVTKQIATNQRIAEVPADF